MSEDGQLPMERDHELGLALREALAPHHQGAFLTRFRSRFAQRTPSWDDQLAHWFWRGLAAATAAMVAAGFGLSQASATSLQDDMVAESAVASQLLEGSTPGADVLFIAMQEGR